MRRAWLTWSGAGRYDDNPRGMLIGERRGLLELLFSLPDKKPCGVHVMGDDLCEVIAAGLVGMILGATCSTFVDTCFNYRACPTCTSTQRTTR